MKLFSREAKDQKHFLETYKQLIQNIMNDPKVYKEDALRCYMQNTGIIDGLADDYALILDVYRGIKMIEGITTKEQRQLDNDEMDRLSQLKEQIQPVIESYVLKNMTRELITFPYPADTALKAEVDAYLNRVFEHTETPKLTDYEVLERTYDTENVDIQRSETGKLINDIIVYLAEHQAQNKDLKLFMCCKQALDFANAASKGLSQLVSKQPTIEVTRGQELDVQETVEDTMPPEIRAQLNREMYCAQLEAVEESARLLRAALPTSFHSIGMLNQLKSIEKSAAIEATDYSPHLQNSSRSYNG